MSEISRATLFGKLNSVLYSSLENAYTFCRLREHNYVELVHWLHQLMQVEQSDLLLIVKHFNLNEAQLRQDILANIERLSSGATAVVDFSEHIQTATEEAWTYSSLKFNEMQIRGGYFIYTLLKVKQLNSLLCHISHEFEKIKPDVLLDNIGAILKQSVEQQSAEQRQSMPLGNDQGGSTKESALAKYGVDLTEKARAGEIDPVTGRDDEIRQMVDILMRRRQNNPILTGEAGVGKTAVVEALALRLASGDVPPSLKDVQLMLLDIGLLKAGASMTGEFEARLRAVMDEVEASAVPIVLFIDEIHTLIGAGGAAGTGDAANLLKPALARGKLRTIGATTWAEYKKYFEKDPALTRRFQVVQVLEPTEDKAIKMLRSLTGHLERHHQVLILDEAIEAAVKLSHRYIPARQLPDKAVGLMDTACARVAVSQHATPSQIEHLQRQLEALAIERKGVKRELDLGMSDSSRLVAIDATITATEAQLAILAERWGTENDLVSRLLSVRQAILAAHQPAVAVASDVAEGAAEDGLAEALVPGAEAEGAPVDIATLIHEQNELIAALTALQQNEPLILSLVDARAVADVVADWTGIPVGKMVKDEVASVLMLADTLNERVIGQRHGLEAITKRIQTARASLDDPNKPIGVFMLAGPSGVGKTETALALAESLYGGEQNVITINMSEYQEAHTVSTLKGAPPGYVGYGEGGVLTEAVRRRPYSVVLLDEVEKAHPDVHEVFFQVFDKGWMEDGEGRYIDFKNTIIILTTNVGTNLVMDMCEDPELLPTPEGLATALREPMLQVFPAALLGRMQVIPY
ncbi:MAG: type VI secretion system ATPase TssH, partial [Neisseriaceae bacterium]|nr:type VI secretion system ATPase TssH [Neisseriaceae bacterium]